MGFSSVILAEYAGGVCGRCERSTFLMKRSSYEYSFVMRSLLISLYNFESCLFQIACLLYFYIAVVIFH
jgi:hypothetical protein